MIRRSELIKAQRQASELLAKTSITLHPDDMDQIEVADFGLSELWISGVQILTLVDTDRIAVKLLILFPYQTEPEHLHPPRGDDPGKEETIRCEWGEVFLYGPGEPTLNPLGRPPRHRRETYTVWKEYHLRSGDQVTFQPNTPHWFQAGEHGCVIWSFSTKAVDIFDVFTDPDIQRTTVIVDD